MKILDPRSPIGVGDKLRGKDREHGYAVRRGEPIKFELE